MKGNIAREINACLQTASPVASACRIELDRYKAFVNTERAAYSGANAKKVYEVLIGSKQKGDVNLFVKEGWVYLYPASGNGIETDLQALTEILREYDAPLAQCV